VHSMSTSGENNLGYHNLNNNLTKPWGVKPWARASKRHDAYRHTLNNGFKCSSFTIITTLLKCHTLLCLAHSHCLYGGDCQPQLACKHSTMKIYRGHMWICELFKFFFFSRSQFLYLKLSCVCSLNNVFSFIVGARKKRVKWKFLFRAIFWPGSQRESAISHIIRRIRISLQ
jgi:hypothetical protein